MIGTVESQRAAWVALTGADATTRSYSVQMVMPFGLQSRKAPQMTPPGGAPPQ